ncbi:PhoX family phosphatase [Acinetobacter bereziniae]|uniref:PhoX family phosphatase n=2 Tax=Acinetobacter bereziniae TaxID=106648 RepID=A0A8I1DHR8_ACIBZ|nr:MULTISPECIES: PhoX family phosphatase [Acinetobacter]MEC8124568.1 PhoX family phosphatase [Pseudomonadota bacterium]ELW80099.1 PF05787 family protein [Acinetobacter sp. WC-743]MBJ8421783.1 PhoX family phosphatase [Acinetobacter bereziniae]MBJ8428088.1 PhoX family phosphatase [Acinetobacter bereziniae]MBJ8477285.1 PhoX family phosphatase [Acinetobacter bereziniae]
MTDLTPYHEDQELDNNTSNNIHFRDILEQRISRRSLITKTASGAAALALASSLTGCNDDDDNHSNTDSSVKKPEKLSFTPVAKNLNDIVTVPAGYEATVLYALGDPLTQNLAEWDDNNVPSGVSFTARSGDCHDGMSYFGLNSSTAKYDAKASNSGLLVMNHEYINQTFLHPKGATRVNGRRPEDEVIREMNAHGVSIIELKKDATSQKVDIVKSSPFNRRITASTVMDFAGIVAGSDLIKTKYSPSAKQTRGTHNNCGNGYTPWGTYLTTEENFIGYFVRNKGDDTKRTASEIIALNRYGLKDGASSRYGWETAIGAIESQDLYDRWNSSITAETADKDYRNSANTFGWIVEIDPFDSRSNPVKRTSLGRFAHEDCRASRLIEGENLTFYMGDDSRGEYIYKFVSDAKWDAKDVNGGYRAGDKYMNSGKLYVAQFNNDGTGKWIELAYGKNGLNDTNTVYPFKSQADVTTFARLAGDAVKATKMDRPEWVAVNPENGEVYVTLTNNSNRGTTHALDAANPRNYSDPEGGKGNVNGHIIRFHEKDNKTTAESFTWDIYLFGAEAKMASNINLSALNDNNDLSSPDGMWFDPRGVLWIQTDDGAYTDTTNCMMLAALPGKVGDGAKAITSAGQETIVGKQVTDENLRRFLTGPKQCEITGVTMTPDYKAIFINVQHPGEDSPSFDKPSSHWPASQKDANNKVARPRSATVVITRKDGGVIAG